MTYRYEFQVLENGLNQYKWYENNALVAQESYRDGKREGIRKIWSAKGKIKMYEVFRDGKKIESKIWYENGVLQSHEFYQDEKLEGEISRWHENGKLWIREFYKGGKLEGECKHWHENGLISAKEFWRNGEPETMQIWSKSGKRII